MTLYDILEVPPGASIKEIRRMYRVKAMQHHPDRGGDSEAFNKVQHAYEVLSDPDRRARYDASGDLEADPMEKLRQEAITAMLQAVTAKLQSMIKELDGSSSLWEHMNKPKLGDPFQMVREDVNATIEGNQEQLRKLALEHRNLQRLACRLRRRGEGPNLVLGHVEQILHGMELSRERGERTIKLCYAVLDELANYEFSDEQNLLGG